MESKYRKYYWLIARDPETGKPYLIFGGDTEEEARQKGFEMLLGMNFDIKALPTRNISTASSILHGKRLEDTHSLREASRRIGHERSLRRRRL